MEGCIKEEVVNIFDVVTSTLPALGIALGEPGACSNNLPRESPWMQFATEFWNGRAIVKMNCTYGEAVLVVGLGETPSFADERALRRSVDTLKTDIIAIIILSTKMHNRDTIPWLDYTADPCSLRGAVS